MLWQPFDRRARLAVGKGYVTLPTWAIRQVGLPVPRYDAKQHRLYGALTAHLDGVLVLNLFQYKHSRQCRPIKASSRAHTIARMNTTDNDVLLTLVGAFNQRRHLDIVGWFENCIAAKLR